MAMDKAMLGQCLREVLNPAAQSPEALKLIEHKIGLLLLQANPSSRVKTSLIVEELLPPQEKENSEPTAKTREELTEEHQQKQKMLNKALDRFSGKRFDDALKTALKKQREEVSLEQLPELSDEELGKAFLVHYRKALKDQGRQNKETREKWEGNLVKQQELKRRLEALIKNKYKTFLGVTPIDQEITNKEKVKQYLEDKFAELATRLSPQELAAELKALQKLVKAHKSDERAIRDSIEEFLKVKLLTYKGSLSELKVTDWEKVEAYIQGKYNEFPLLEETTAIREINGFLQLMDNMQVQHNMSEDYGEQPDTDAKPEEAESFIRLAQEFYTWINLLRAELPLYCVLTAKAKKDYCDSEINPTKLKYARDYLTFELSTKQCTPAFIQKIGEAQLPEAYEKLKLEDFHLINMALFHYLRNQPQVPKAGAERNELYYKYNSEQLGQTKPKAKTLGENLSTVEVLLEGFRYKKS